MAAAATTVAAAAISAGISRRREVLKPSPCTSISIGAADGEDIAQIAAGVRRRVLDDLLGRPDRDDLPALFAAFRPEVDDPVGGLDHVEIVLDHEQAVARLQQLAERRQQLGDVVEMQPGGRLVEDVEHAVAGLRRQMRRNLDALRFAARQRRRRLAETQVAEADLVEHLQAAQHLRRAAEERQRLAHGQVEHLIDAAAAVLAPRGPAA